MEDVTARLKLHDDEDWKLHSFPGVWWLFGRGLGRAAVSNLPEYFPRAHQLRRRNFNRRISGRCLSPISQCLNF